MRDILDTDATSASPIECNQVLLQVLSSFCGFDPSLGAERVRVGEDGGIAMDEICGTADRGLFFCAGRKCGLDTRSKRGGERALKIRLFIKLTPGGITYCLYCRASFGATRGSRAVIP